MSPAERLKDEDSDACQVQTFLDSVEPMSGSLSNMYCDGYAMVSRFVAHLAIEGDGACPELTPYQAAAVLQFLQHIQTREGKEDHAAGGSAHCGINHVLHWVSLQVMGFQASELEAVQS